MMSRSLQFKQFLLNQTCDFRFGLRHCHIRSALNGKVKFSFSFRWRFARWYVRTAHGDSSFGIFGNLCQSLLKKKQFILRMINNFRSIYSNVFTDFRKILFDNINRLKILPYSFYSINLESTEIKD